MSAIEAMSDRPPGPTDETRIITSGPSPTRPACSLLGATGRDRGTPIFVWGSWASMLLAALIFIAHYGGNVPYWDEWDGCVRQLTGDEPVDAAWLWKPHNEHRIPLPKLILVGLFRLTGDLRAGMYLNALALGALAAVLILAARFVRGRLSYTDAIFPLALLNWGHSHNLLWSWQVQFVSSTLFAGILLALVACQKGPLTPVSTVLAGLCLLLLPLCGANGLIVMPFGAAWLGYAGLLLGRSPGGRSRWQRPLIAVLVGAALLFIPLSLFRLEKSELLPPCPGLGSALRTSLEYLSISFGPGAVRLDDRSWKYAGLLMAGLLVLTGLLLAVAWWKRPQERLRALGLLALMGAMVALALIVGWGRSGFGPSAGLMGRYATLGVLTLCCCYFAWLLYSPPALGGLGEMCLFTGVALLLVPNMEAGKEHGRESRRMMSAFEGDVRAGEPPYRLARRYAPALFHHGDTVFFPMMKRAGIGVFRYLQENPPFHEIPVPVMPASAHQVTWHDGTAQGNGRDSYLVFHLKDPRYVAGIRLTYIHSNRSGSTPTLDVYWKAGEQADFPAWPNLRDRFLRTGPEPRTVVIWVDEVIDEIRIHPDQIPYNFEIKGLALMVPATDGPASAGHEDPPGGSKSTRKPPVMPAAIREEQRRIRLANSRR